MSDPLCAGIHAVFAGAAVQIAKRTLLDLVKSAKKGVDTPFCVWYTAAIEFTNQSSLLVCSEWKGASAMHKYFGALLRQNFRCGRMSCSRVDRADRAQGFAAVPRFRPKKG